jgi:hypothetical protein
VDEDRVVEDFKTKYQDSESRVMRKPPATSAGKQDEKKGPKMGGSKNVRRMMEENAAGKKT